MGACNIDFTLKGKASRTEIQKAFTEQRENDAIENGRGSYTGDFQTVRRVVFETDTVFASLDQAYDFCLEKAEKFETVIAVYFQNGATIDTLVAGWASC